MQSLRGCFLMIAAMAAFAVEDALIKHISATLPVGQILVVLGGGGVVAFLTLGRARGIPVLSPDLLAPASLLRGLGELVGAVSMVMALSLVPLGVTTTLLQALPLAVTLGAALAFGEPVGWRRWSAIIVGFFGVLVILRPGAEAFDPAALLALLAVAGMTVRDLATRRLPPELPTVSVAACSFAVVVPAGLVMIALGHDPVPIGPAMAVKLALCLAIGMAAYMAIIVATRVTDIAVIAPFRYSRMLFGLVIGMLFFDETPDAMVYLGAAMILGAGVFTVWREARLRRATRPSLAAAGPV